jgi:hypothetical protein
VSADPLSENRPVLRYDTQETAFATSIDTIERLVDADGRTIAVTPRLSPRFLGAEYPAHADASPDDHVEMKSFDGPARVYGRQARGSDGRRWLQYWLFYRENPQDRGIIRTGRHAGDWEFVQVRLGPGADPDRVTLAQHRWAESCAWPQVRHRDGAPVIYPANGSHASYAAPGTKDRPWPDPNDEADGRGRTARPAVVRIDGRTSWVRWPGRWGQSRAGVTPGEQSSPRGPAFQDDERWSDPSAYDAGARPCGAGPPGRPWQTPLVVVLLLAALALGPGRRLLPRIAHR